MEIVARRIIASMAKPVQMEDQSVGLTASLGLAVFPLDGQEADGLLDRAKQAMVRAQETGGGGYQLYTVS